MMKPLSRIFVKFRRRMTGVKREIRDKTGLRRIGGDLFDDIQKFTPLSERGIIIFDVGANIGQSAVLYRRRLPQATLYCFEPISSTCNTLRKNLAGYENVVINEFALGDVDSEKLMTCRRNYVSNQMVELIGDVNPTNTERVNQRSGVSICRDLGVDEIFLLKIDTEGFEMKVLEGFSAMLIDQKVNFVQLEAAMNSTNDRHVPFVELLDYMRRHRYYLFGIYDQVSEFHGRAILRRSNTVFISKALVEVIDSRQVSL